MMLPPATRVYLACGFTDMRRYAECSVMLSRFDITPVFNSSPIFESA